MNDYQVPGVYWQDVFATPAPQFLTGVPAFLGYAGTGPGEPQMLTLWPQFEAAFGAPPDTGFLADAVRGFFENDGLLCYVLRLDDAGAPVDELRRGLAALSDLENVDLICAPDVMRPATSGGDPDPAVVMILQREILDYCQQHADRFAILDGLPTIDPAAVAQQRAALVGDYGALYYPWLGASGPEGRLRYVPPCGYVAGSYSRSDQRIGVHKAPANEAIDGVLDLRVNLTAQQAGELYAQAVNCLQAFPGRGIRVWGARTLSNDPAGRYVNVRRTLITLGRWLERFMTTLVYEANDVRLWVRIMRELTSHLEGLFQRGALKGRSPDEAFFVKCDGETNGPAVIDAGIVVTQIGVALVAPAEFIIVRVIHGASGVTITAAP